MAQEYLQGIGSNGEYLNQKIDRKEAHEKGLLHKSVHVWGVDANKEKYNGDIGIYVAVRAKGKSFTGEEYIQRTAGGHMDYLEDEKTLEGDTQKFSDKKSMTTFVRETAEELGLSLLSENKVQNGVEIQDMDIIGKNIKYSGEKKKVKDGKEERERNNELIDVYMIQMEGKIQNFDTGEIGDIEIIPSKKLLEILETNPERFGIKEKHSRKEKLIKYVIYQLQKKYLVSRK